MSDFQWSRDYLAAHKRKALGVISVLVLRYLYTLLFLYGFVHKIIHGWMWSDILTRHFTQMLQEKKGALPSTGTTESAIALFQAVYLEHFAIPFVMPIALVVTIGELIIGAALFFGITTRINAAFGLFMLLNFAAGGYYNATIPPLITISVLLMVLPTGHWLGLDGKLNRKYPDSPWFR